MPPAARISDPTAHAGAIIPPGETTVLIGDLPAAREGDAHLCPLADGAKPHVGGTITRGEPTVLIGDKPAARELDPCGCAGPAGGSAASVWLGPVLRLQGSDSNGDGVNDTWTLDFSIMGLEIDLASADGDSLALDLGLGNVGVTITDSDHDGTPDTISLTGTASKGEITGTVVGDDGSSLSGHASSEFLGGSGELAASVTEGELSGHASSEAHGARAVIGGASNNADGSGTSWEAAARGPYGEGSHTGSASPSDVAQGHSATIGGGEATLSVESHDAEGRSESWEGDVDALTLDAEIGGGFGQDGASGVVSGGANVAGVEGTHTLTGDDQQEELRARVTVGPGLGIGGEYDRDQGAGDDSAERFTVSPPWPPVGVDVAHTKAPVESPCHSSPAPNFVLRGFATVIIGD